MSRDSYSLGFYDLSSEMQKEVKKDLESDLLLVELEAKQTFTGKNDCTFSSYSYRCKYSYLVDLLNKKNIKTRLIDTEEEYNYIEDVSSPEERIDAKDDFDRFFALLTPLQREIVKTQFLNPDATSNVKIGHALYISVHQVTDELMKIEGIKQVFNR